METKNNGAIITYAQLDAPEITDKTTLGELLSILNLTSTSRKPSSVPTRKKLGEIAGAPIAVGDGCEVYSNGWAVYENGTGRTVVWLPSCANFTYHFGELKPYEKEYLKQEDTLDKELLISNSWVLAVTLIGDHRVERNNMNRTGSRLGTRVYSSVDENGDEIDDIEEIAYCKGGKINDRSLGVSPLDAFADKEYSREALEAERTATRVLQVEDFGKFNQLNDKDNRISELEQQLNDKNNKGFFSRLFG